MSQDSTDTGSSSAPTNSAPSSLDTVLVVDDVAEVRNTFREWLESANLNIQILTAHDAESALAHASGHTIDLAVLDWNLETGDTGLDLLEDLSGFHPDVVAIMITGFAHQATPLEAMRKGVRDYLDKNHDLNRETFLKSIRRQLEIIRPAKRERAVHAQLLNFRQSIETILPVVEQAAALKDPVTLPDAIANLFRFLLRSTRASDGVLLVRTYDENRDPMEICRVYDSHGELMNASLLPFSQSLAGAVVCLGEARVLTNPEMSTLQEFEKNRRSILIAPLMSGTSQQAVIELFDKEGEEGFDDSDRQIAESTAEFGGELFRHALAEQRTKRALVDVMTTALEASSTLAETLESPSHQGTPPSQMMDRLQQDLESADNSPLSSRDAVQIAEAIRGLAVHHGPQAVQYCLRQIESVRGLLDSLYGMEELS